MLLIRNAHMLYMNENQKLLSVQNNYFGLKSVSKVKEEKKITEKTVN